MHQDIVNFYLKDSNLKQINNWNLVDASCYKILGEYLVQNPQEVDILFNFASSKDLWRRRIAVVTTFAFIKKDVFVHTLKICEVLFSDEHDLIQKATGWMLREIGKRNQEILCNFLNKNIYKMSRVSLSYAIEKLCNEEKIVYRRLKAKGLF